MPNKSSEFDQNVIHKLFSQPATKGQLQRLKIAEAAYDLVDQEGVESLTYDAIGLRLGLKSSHIAYYFSSKQELVHAALKLLIMRVQDYYVAKIQGQKTPKNQLKAYLSAAFLGMVDQPNMMRNIALMFYSASHDPSGRELYLQAKLSGVERLKAILVGVDKLNLFPKKSIEHLAEEIIILVHGRILQCVIHRDPVYIRKMEKETIKDVAVLCGFTSL